MEVKTINGIAEILYALLFIVVFGQNHDLAAVEYISHHVMGDGFGAQFQGIINAVFYAESVGKEYAYTPFTKMEHNYDNDPEFLQKKEWLINFKDNFKLNTMQAERPHPGSLILFFEENIQKVAKSESLKKIKQVFRANKNKAEYFNPGNFNIAIHIRRCNAVDGCIAGRMNTPDSTYLNMIQKLRIIYHMRRPIFHIYSQGNSQQFKDYEAGDAILHLNDSVESTFTSMVLADALITSTSSFSYVAGLLSEGAVFYVPFWDKPMPHWISVSNK